MEAEEQRAPAETGSFLQRLFRLSRGPTVTAAASADNHDTNPPSSEDGDSDPEIVFNTRQYSPEGNSDPINEHEQELTHSVQNALHVTTKRRTDTPYQHNVRRSTPKHLSNIAEASRDLLGMEDMSTIEVTGEVPANVHSENDGEMSPKLVRKPRVTFYGCTGA